MQIDRLFTSSGTGPYHDISVRPIKVDLPTGLPAEVASPSAWPVSAATAFAHHALRAAPTPPSPDSVDAVGAETDIRTAIDRVAGTLARTGWDNGYFDSDADARAFSDELRACLVARRFTFSPQIWQSVGPAQDGRTGQPPYVQAAAHHRACPVIRGHAVHQALANQARRADDAGALALGRHLLGDIRARIQAALKTGDTDPRTNAALRHALGAATELGLPATAARRLTDLAAAKPLAAMEAPDTHLDCDSDIWTALASVDIYAAGVGRGDATSLHALALASHAGTAPSVIFTDNVPAATLTADGTHSLTASGRIGPAATTPSGTLNIAAFTRSKAGGGMDIAGLVHATRLMTIALDIVHATVPDTGPDTGPARPLGVSLANIAPIIMRHGHAYACDDGRAIAAMLAALVTATSLAASAELAACLTPCPGFAAARASALRFAAKMQRALSAQAAPQQSASSGAPPLHPRTTEQALVLDAARSTMARAVAQIEATGLRNLALTCVAEDTAAGALLAAEAVGIGPMTALVQHRRLTPDFDGSAIYKTVSSAVPAALRALHYDDAAIDRLIDYVVGHGSLADAPGVNHALLREHGFTDRDIETVERGLATAGNIRAVFTPYTLGWQRVPDGAEDLLTWLGFSEWDVEHANFHCCGAQTLEGAPGLPQEHLPVFDCARPLGQIGTRYVRAHDRLAMAKCIHPFLTNGIALDLDVPADTHPQAILALYQDAERSGLTSIRLTRQDTALTDPLTGPLSYDEMLGGAPDTAIAELDDKIAAGTAADDGADDGAEDGAGTHLAGRKTQPIVDLASAICVGLEHGVPLAAYASVFSSTDDAPSSRAYNAALQAIASQYLTAAVAPHTDIPSAGDDGNAPSVPAQQTPRQPARAHMPVTDGIPPTAAGRPAAKARRASEPR